MAPKGRRPAKPKSTANDSGVWKKPPGKRLESSDSGDEGDFERVRGRGKGKGIRADEIELDDAEDVYHSERARRVLRDGEDELEVFDNNNNSEEDEVFGVGIGRGGKRGKKATERDVLVDLGISDSDEEEEQQEEDYEEGFGEEEEGEEDSDDDDAETEAVLRKYGLPRPSDRRDSDDSEADSQDEEPEEQAKSLGWGRKSAFYGGDEATALEDEEARELEEQEVLRLEKKRAEFLGDEDIDDIFGIPAVTTETAGQDSELLSDDGWDMDGTRGLSNLGNLAANGTGTLDPALQALVENGTASADELLAAAPELETLAQEAKEKLDSLETLNKAAAAWTKAKPHVRADEGAGAAEIARAGELVSAKYRGCFVVRRTCGICRGRLTHRIILLLRFPTELTLNYLSAVSFYFLLINSLFSSSSTFPSDPQNHPVTTHLARLSMLLNEIDQAEHDAGVDPVEETMLELLGDGFSDGEEEEDGDELDEEEDLEEDIQQEIERVQKKKKKGTSKESKQGKKDAKPTKSSKRKHTADASNDQQPAPLPNKQPQQKSLLFADSDLPKFKPLPVSKPTKKALLPSDLLDSSDDPLSRRLQSLEAQEREQRLKFTVPLHSVIHAVSQSVAPKQSKYDGDAELPRRDGSDKKKEREASARGLSGDKKAEVVSEDADVFSSGSEDEDEPRSGKGKGNKRPSSSDNQDEQEQEDPLAYYQSVVDSAKRRKLAKAAELASFKTSTIPLDPTTLDPDTKRATNYAILKNRGLSVRKNKIERNPRLKKRVKYEKMMKKLGSTKRIYKAEGRREQGYRGEATGIKTNVRKSVRLV